MSEEADALPAVVRRELGREIVARRELAPGLGSRRFIRLSLDAAPTHVIARLETPRASTGGEPPLEPLRTILEQADLPVPKRFGGDPSRGIDLLEDVGDENLEIRSARLDPDAFEALIARILADLPRLQAITGPADLPALGRRLDSDLIALKGRVFARYSLRGSADAVVEEGFRAIAERLAGAPMRLAHRDFQSQNIFIQQREGKAIPRWIDIQGAFLAPPEYDAVCLLRDSYLEFPEGSVSRLIAGLRPSLPDAPSQRAFAERFSLLSLARKGKDHGRFLEAARKRGDRRYLRYTRRTWQLVRAAASECAGFDPRLERLNEVVAAMPPEQACEA